MKTQTVTKIDISTPADARTVVYNSTLADSPLPYGGTLEGFAKWLYTNHKTVDRHDLSPELAEYLGTLPKGLHASRHADRRFK